MENNISSEELAKAKEIIAKLWNYYESRIVRTKRTWKIFNNNTYDKSGIYF